MVMEPSEVFFSALALQLCLLLFSLPNTAANTEGRLVSSLLLVPNGIAALSLPFPFPLSLPPSPFPLPPLRLIGFPDLGFWRQASCQVHTERCGVRMPGSFTRFLCSFSSPFSHDDERDDPSLWSRDLRSFCGHVSAAVIQANQVLEDQCRVESGDFGTFVGLFDGHGGPHAARYTCDHLFQHYIDISSGPDSVTDNSIKRAFLATEEGFINLVSQLWNTEPDIATCGTCCLVGVIQKSRMHIANAGDSRVVLGKRVGHKVEAVQLSTEHNANLEEIRREMKARHPDDPQIVEFKHGVWRIKGIIQVSRSIGDAYLKYAEYNREPIKPKFRISEPFISPILTADPTIISREIQPNDAFLIFASDGLWEHLSNQEAVDIVHNHPHAGSAKRLIKAALQDAARKREMRYSDLISIDKKVRRHFHDDITVIIVFLSHGPFQGAYSQTVPTLSLRSPLDN